jgi:hypothetical protein
MSSGSLLSFFDSRDNEVGVNNPNHRYLNDRPLLLMPQSVNSDFVVTRFMPWSYEAGGVTFTGAFMIPSTSIQAVRFRVAFERLKDDGQDLDSDGYGGNQDLQVLLSGLAANQAHTFNIPFNHGSEIDNVVAGELMRIRLRRNGTNAQDSYLGDLYFVYGILKET